MVRILGILNVTRDSFSDGGRFLEPAAALDRARQLLADGAAAIDVGAESTHPDAEAVSAEEELRRLQPVVERLLADGVRVSVDTVKPAVMRQAGRWGVHFLNDVGGMRDPDCIAAAAATDATVIAMFARTDGGRAVRGPGAAGTVLDEIEHFAAGRLQALAAAGIDRSRVVLDPGMGFFLGDGPEPSLVVLRGLPRLQRLGLPLLVSVSRKSFLGALTGRAAAERGAATLAAELFAARQGVHWIRTHEPGPLRDGLRVQQVLEGGGNA